MAGKRRIDMRFATQILLLQLAVVALTLGIAFALLAFLGHRRLAAEDGHRVLDVARVLAESPAVRSDVARYDRPLTDSPALTDELERGPLQNISSTVKERTDALFVVITNSDGIRLSHPNVSELGKRVSTDPSSVLSGREEVTRQTGTLGPSVRAKVPIRAPNSERVVGEVSVGMSTAAVHAQLRSDLWAAGWMSAIALAVGTLTSWLLARRWRGQTPLRTTEMAALVRTQEAVLHGIGEGVLAASADGTTALVNDEACRLLEIDSPTGKPVDEIGLTPGCSRCCDPVTPPPRWPPSVTGWWSCRRDGCRGTGASWEPCW